MSYLDRLQPEINFTSPSGLEFSAKWSGNIRTLEKELGIFKTPGVQGIISQDLDVRGEVYPLTFFFDGPNNDLEANRFFETCKENGEWTVVHPVHGTKTLQLVTVSEAVQPVSSGNVTEITSEWLEVSEGKGTKSAVQLSAEAVSQSVSLDSTGTDQLDNVVKIVSADQNGKFQAAVENTVIAFNNTLESITSTAAEVQAQADSIKRGIDATLLEQPIDVLSVAGQIQALIALPNLVVTDVNSKVETFVRFKDLILGFSPESNDLAEINTAAVQEIALTAAVGAVGVASVTSELTSRQSVIELIESNLAFFNDVTDGLDTVQELYSANLISESYFSQSQSFVDSALMVALTLAYLIKSSFDLAVEKKIVLTEEENPVIVAMREYNGSGEDDSNIDLFYSSNNLTDQETVLLPQGREIVVYL
jgi:prophage DNA circulation protein